MLQVEKRQELEDVMLNKEEATAMIMRVLSNFLNF